MFAENVVGVVVDDIDSCADFDPFPCRADDERGFAAFGDRENNVFCRDAQIADLFFAELSEVFETLDRLNERKIASSHDAECAFFQFLRGWRAFQASRPLVLPEIAPDRNQLDAESPG